MEQLPRPEMSPIRASLPALFTKYDRPVPVSEPEPDQPAESAKAKSAEQPQGAAAPQPDGAAEMVAELQAISRAHPVGGFGTGEGGLWIGYRDDWWRENQETWKTVLLPLLAGGGHGRARGRGLHRRSAGQGVALLTTRPVRPGSRSAMQLEAGPGNYGSFPGKKAKRVAEARVSAACDSKKRTGKMETAKQIAKVPRDFTCTATAGVDSSPAKLSAGLIRDRFSPGILDHQACCRLLAGLLHPAGPACPDCGQAIEAGPSRRAFERFARVHCRGCGRWFTAASGTILQGAKLTAGQIVLLAVFLALEVETVKIAGILAVSPETVRQWKQRLS